MLLTGTALLVRTLNNLDAIHPGFDPRGVVTADIELPSDRYPTEASRNAFFQQLLGNLTKLPTIQNTAFSRSTTSGEFSLTWAVQPDEGQPLTELVGMNDVSGGYFDTLRIPFLAGHTFDDAHPSPDSVVISQSLADRLWPGRSAIGRRLRLGNEAPWWTVIGVVRDVENRLLQLGPVTDQRVSRFLYVPFADRLPPRAPTSTARRVFVPRVLVVRTSDADGLVPMIKAQVSALDASQPVERVELADSTYASQFDRQRFVVSVVTAFSGVALLLAAAGVFGVLAQRVARRTPEIALRMALGATPGDIVRMVLKHGLGLTAMGTAIGLVGALALSQLMTSMLFEVSTHDPVSYVAVMVVLVATAMAACWLPTRRAMKIEPATALRDS